MKKLLVLALAVALVLAMATTCFATTAVTTIESVAAGSNTATREVYADIIRTTNEAVYGVDVSWAELSFAYTYANKWNPDTMAYDDAQPGSWTDAEGKITVSNRSNADIVATVAFQAAQGITASFKDNKTSATLTSAAVSNQATSETFTLNITAGTPDLSAATAKIGTVTVSIAASTAN